MAAIPGLSEDIIHKLADSRSIERGESYFENGAVLEVVRRGEEITAEVEGSDVDPYQVRLLLNKEGVSETSCTCPYDWGGACKHIVATLLYCLHRPGEIEERLLLPELLAGLDREQLARILMAAASAHPEIVDLVERQALLVKQPAQAPVPSASPASTDPQASPSTTAPPAAQAFPPPDLKSIQRQVRSIFRSLDSDDYYGYSSSVVSMMQEILEEARQRLEAGDGCGALSILEMATGEYMQRWSDLDDSDGELGTYFDELGERWSEALLSTELTPAERHSWKQRLETWQGEVEEYGIDAGFSVALLAVEHGWDYPPLQRVLQGEITEKGAWEEEAPGYAYELAQIRLRILDRQGRTQEYLHLAEAEGQTAEYVTMLVRVGRINEAVDYGLNFLSTPQEALALAVALREANATGDVLCIANHGLGLEGDKVRLGRWLRDEARAAGDTPLALKAAGTAFRESLNLDDYKAVEALAGEKWPSLKKELLRCLHSDGSSYPGDPIDIFLYEGLVEDAIRWVDKQDYVHHSTLEKVASAAIRSRPDWTIRIGKREAEGIMDKGKSNYYSNAVSWLAMVRDASVAPGQEEEWKLYLQQVMNKHSRKYSLVPMLKNLHKRR